MRRRIARSQAGPQAPRSEVQTVTSIDVHDPGPSAPTHLGEPHEHVFYPHDDPRWLVCDCGQYAVRARTITGEASVRLIDPPRPALGQPHPSTSQGSSGSISSSGRRRGPAPHDGGPREPQQRTQAAAVPGWQMRCRDVVARTSDFVLEVDPTMTITWVSESLAEVLGWRPEQWVGTPAWTWFPDQAPEEQWHLLARALHGEVVSGPRRVLAADGSEAWVDRTANPLREWTGEVVAIVTSFHLLTTVPTACSDAAAPALRRSPHAEAAAG